MSFVKIVMFCASCLGLFVLALFLFPLAVINAFAALGAYHVTRDVAYADGERHGLDVYRPAHSDGPAPVIIFFYGGSWDQGDKSMYQFVGAALAARGFVTIIPDYRLYPEVMFPGFLEDGAKAVAWVRNHAASFGGDPSEIVLMGHSAGAHIAAMLSFDRQWLAAVGLDPARDIKGMVGLAGPYDFLPLHSDRLKRIFGAPEQLAATQPINFVTAAAPRAFLGRAVQDHFVDPGNSTRLAARIAQKGGRTAVIKDYAYVNHHTLIGAFSIPLRLLAPVVQDVTQFVHDVTDTQESAKPSASSYAGLAG